MQVNSQFATEPVIEIPELPWWKQPDNIELAKSAGKNLVLGGLALFLMLGVLRPMLRRFLGPMQAAAAQSGAASGAPEGQPATEPAKARTPHDTRHQENMKYAQESAVQGPQMVAMLVKSWMDKKDG